MKETDTRSENNEQACSVAEAVQTAKTEDVLAISKRLLEKNREAYEVLAK